MKDRNWRLPVFVFGRSVPLSSVFEPIRDLKRTNGRTMRTMTLLKKAAMCWKYSNYIVLRSMSIYLNLLKKKTQYNESLSIRQKFQTNSSLAKSWNNNDSKHRRMSNHPLYKTDAGLRTSGTCGHQPAPRPHFFFLMHLLKPDTVHFLSSAVIMSDVDFPKWKTIFVNNYHNNVALKRFIIFNCSR